MLTLFIARLQLEDDPKSLTANCDEFLTTFSNENPEIYSLSEKIRLMIIMPSAISSGSFSRPYCRCSRFIGSDDGNNNVLPLLVRICAITLENGALATPFFLTFAFHTDFSRELLISMDEASQHALVDSLLTAMRHTLSPRKTCPYSLPAQHTALLDGASLCLELLASDNSLHYIFSCRTLPTRTAVSNQVHLLERGTLGLFTEIITWAVVPACLAPSAHVSAAPGSFLGSVASLSTTLAETGRLWVDALLAASVSPPGRKGEAGCIW